MKRNCGCRQEQSELNDKDRVGTEQKSGFYSSGETKRRNKEVRREEGEKWEKGEEAEEWAAGD